MKKVFLLVVLTLVGLCAFAAGFKKGDTVYVSTKTAVLKNGDGNFAKDVATVNYGDQLKVLSVSGKKVQVQIKDKKTSGWIASNSVTTKKIVKSSTGNSVNASTKELALAGKGFSEETEEIYKNSGGDLDFSKVDLIEKASTNEQELEKFITEGHLLGGSK